MAPITEDGWPRSRGPDHARFQKRAHNPLLVAAAFDTTDVAIPWLGGKRLRLVFG
jgi:hypothetical protein